MRLTKEALSIRMVIRRAARGSAPFRWEVYHEESAELLHSSLEQFDTMEAAYHAGQARLAEFVPVRAKTHEVTSNHRWASRELNHARLS